MFDKNKKHLLAVLAAALVLTFSGSICAFAEENVVRDSSSADASIIIEETSENGSEEDAAKDSDKEESNSENSADEEGTSKVIIAGNSGQKAETDTKASRDETEDTADHEPEDTSADDSADDSDNGMVSLGIFRTTAYCPCYACSEGYGRHTCTGATARSNHTIAVDPRVIPFGSKVMINGIVYTAEDRGGAVRGNHVDIFFDSHAQTRQYGTRAAEVFLLA